MNATPQPPTPGQPGVTADMIQHLLTAGTAQQVAPPVYQQPQQPQMYQQPQQPAPAYQQPQQPLMYQPQEPAAPPTYQQPQYQPQQPQPGPPPEPRKKAGKKRFGFGQKNPAPAPAAGGPAEPGTPAPNPAPVGGSRGAGGRALLIAGRILIVLVLAVIMLRGVMSFVAPTKQSTPEQFATDVSNALGYTGFPIEAGTGLALQVAHTYLTYSPATVTARNAAMQSYAPEVPPLTWAMSGDQTQAIVEGPLQVSAPELIDAQHALYSLTARIKSGATADQWINLTIPLYADGNKVSMSGPVGFAPAAARAVLPLAPDPGDSDEALQNELTTSILPGYLTDWAKSDPARLATWLTTDASPAARAGLGNAVTYSALGSVWASPTSDPTTGAREVHVTVEWANPGGIAYTQAYTLQVAPNGDGLWKIQDISAGLDTTLTPLP